MNDLDKKINENFPGSVVRKDLVKEVKGNAIVPSFVLEYLLGQYCATNDEKTIAKGIESVKEILAKHYVNRHEAELIKSNIRERGHYKVIDKIYVELDESKDCYQATFTNLGINKVIIDSITVNKKHPRLLVSGVWCLADLEYHYTENKNESPWILTAIKPIQLSQFNLDDFIASRSAFNTQEWVDMLIQSIGFNPTELSWRNKLLQLVRLIPFCERNYNLIELGPKGTGKSHIYTEFSPHGTLLSGGEVTVAKLFVNNAKKHDIGLVGYWDNIAFDEFAGRQKRIDKALVDIMKGYMANKSFSRGVETLGAEASMTFVGNTKHNVPYMLKNSHLFEELPEKFLDSAFLDRLHFYIPGWEIGIIRSELFSKGYGLVVDYLAEALKSLRNYDFSNEYRNVAELSTDLSTRDRDGILKTFSGLMKIIYPNKSATKEEKIELLSFAMEGRKRVKDQILRIDKTFPAVDFSFNTAEKQTIKVQCAEEIQYNQYYMPQGITVSVEDVESGNNTTNDSSHEQNNDIPSYREIPLMPNEKKINVQENQIGISFESLFGPYLNGAKSICIRDPYLLNFYQRLNLMEFIMCVVAHKRAEDCIKLHLVTRNAVEKWDGHDSQGEQFQIIRNSCEQVGIEFSYTFEESRHDRSITIDDTWEISLGRGLDIYQVCERKDMFSLTSHLQELRPCKQFEVTFLKHSKVQNAK